MGKPRYDIGFLGGGQLARMSIQAAQKMGLKCISLDPSSNSPASQIADSLVGDLNNAESVAKIIECSNKVTLENEFIKGEILRQAFRLAKLPESNLLPGIETLETIQDKLHQSQALQKWGVPCPISQEINPDQIDALLANIQFPIVLKARYGGYDGKGTRYAKSREEFLQFKSDWQDGGWMTQEFVPFKRELAVMVYRSPHSTGTFPTMETLQTNHVCDLVYPANIDASEIAVSAIEAVGGYGLFGVEIFETESGEFLINEIAPRPHNTGHFSQDWGTLSQFDVHIRLCLGLPIPEIRGNPTTMANVLGIQTDNEWQPAMRETLRQIPEANFHWYGKAESRPGRKLGHINVTGNNSTEIAKRAREIFLNEWANVTNSK